jgi:hypothetical protein
VGEGDEANRHDLPGFSIIMGNIDILGTDMLFGGSELQKLLEAGESGRIQLFSYPGGSWEHLDMNLYDTATE